MLMRAKKKSSTNGDVRRVYGCVKRKAGVSRSGKVEKSAKSDRSTEIAAIM